MNSKEGHVYTRAPTFCFLNYKEAQLGKKPFRQHSGCFGSRYSWQASFLQSSFCSPLSAVWVIDEQQANLGTRDYRRENLVPSVSLGFPDLVINHSGQKNKTRSEMEIPFGMLVSVLLKQCRFLALPLNSLLESLVLNFNPFLTALAVWTSFVIASLVGMLETRSSCPLVWKRLSLFLKVFSS